MRSRSAIPRSRPQTPTATHGAGKSPRTTACASGLAGRWDFLVVADHAEYLGGFYRFEIGDPLVTETPTGERWQALRAAGEDSTVLASFVASIVDPLNNPGFPEETRRVIWDDVVETADSFNDPGRFHCVLRIRVVLDDQWQQPAPGGHLQGLQRTRCVSYYPFLRRTASILATSGGTSPRMKARPVAKRSP